ncbi:MAG: ribose 5-phosphate isomerase B [Anaerolineales bacterium]
MNAIDDAEIRQIVQRVLSQVMGISPRNTAPSSVPAKTDSAHPVPPAEAEPSPKAPEHKVVAIGADHGGFELKEILKADLAAMGYDVRDMGTYTKASVDYPDYALEVAKLVSSGKAWRGIMIDGAGIGSCIVANKVPGVRAGMAYDYSSAVNSREHNNTNLLTLGAGLIGVNLAKLIVQTWLTTEFAGGRHAGRVDKITAIEKQYFK